MPASHVVRATVGAQGCEPPSPRDGLRRVERMMCEAGIHRDGK
jgi:hypothetical protein